MVLKFVVRLLEVDGEYEGKDVGFQKYLLEPTLTFGEFRFTPYRFQAHARGSNYEKSWKSIVCLY